MKRSDEKSIKNYLGGLKSESRLALEALDKLIRNWQPQLEVRIWQSMGYQIIGYGQSTYKYSNGRLGQWFIVGLCAHKSCLSLYVWGFSNKEYLLETYKDKLGRVKIGKSCLNFKTLAELNLKILQEVVQKAVDLNEKP